MVKKATNRLSILLGVVFALILCVTVLNPIKVKAEGDSSRIEPTPPSNFTYIQYYVDGNSEGRDFGKGYAGTVNADSAVGHECFGRSNDGKSYHYTFTIVTQDNDIDELYLFDVDDYVDGDVWALRKDFKCKYDKAKKTYTYTYSVTSKHNLSFYLINYSNRKIKYKICITREPEITLAKTAISEITNTKQRTMTVKYAPVKKRLGYQIEYATDNKFKDKARVNTGATTKDIGKLTRGKTYYVRVRTYARYNDGTLVYSKWSGTRKIKITK